MALDNTALLKTTNMNPAQVERAKTPQEKAEDAMYLSNHTGTCLLFTDMFGLAAAGNFINSTFGTKLQMDHDHNNGYGPFEWSRDNLSGKHKDADYVHKIHHKEDHRIAHELEHAEEHMAKDIAAGRKPTIHPDPARKLTPDSSFKEAGAKFLNNSKKWLLAEAVGDVGAVPFTIMVQRHAPGFMNWIRQGLEPIVGGVFHKNTHRAAVGWGNKHGFGKDSQEVTEYGNMLYEYEMRHLPQMAVWTVSSIGLNFGAMHAFHKMDPRQFEKTGVKEFAMVKGAGAVMTAGVVLLLRGITPGGAHKWDQTMGKHVIMPITKKVGALFGIRPEDVDDFQRKREDITAGQQPRPVGTKVTKQPAQPETEVTEKNWSGRMQETKAEARLQA